MDEIRTVQVRTHKRFPGWREFSSPEYEPEVRGKKGKLYPWDEDTIAVYIHSSSEMVRKVAELPGARIFNRGDGEGTVLVPNSLLDTVAVMVGASKIRKMTEEQKAALSDRLSLFKFQKKDDLSEDTRHSDATEGESTLEAVSPTLGGITGKGV